LRISATAAAPFITLSSRYRVVMLDIFLTRSWLRLAC
jgi:hypothetical protein